MSQQAELIIMEKVHDRQIKKLDTKIASVPRPRFGLLLCSILDSHSCSWFDMLNDKVKYQDLFDLVKEGDNDSVERVSLNFICSEVLFFLHQFTRTFYVRVNRRC